MFSEKYKKKEISGVYLPDTPYMPKLLQLFLFVFIVILTVPWNINAYFLY